MKNEFILIEDTTLREGEQTPGVSFNFSQKRKILEQLSLANVPYAEVGIAAMGNNSIQEIKDLVKDPFLPKLIGWNRGRKEDLDKSFDSGLTRVHIGLPSSEIHIKNTFKKDENWVIETAVELVEYSKKSGAEFISVSAEDMGRADINFLKKYSSYLEKAGASRMRLSDTIGCLNPEKTKAIVQNIKEVVPNLDLQMHMHNDLGLSLANCMAGVDAGARQVHATINGLGDRAGITSLHQIVVGLEMLTKYKTGIRIDRLYTLSQLLENFTKLDLAHNEPIVGRDVFSHESGIHVDGLLKEKSSFEVFDPVLLNREHKFVIGKHTGSSAVIHALEKLGVVISREEAKELLPDIRKYAAEKKFSILNDEELLAIVNKK